MYDVLATKLRICTAIRGDGILAGLYLLTGRHLVFDSPVEFDEDEILACLQPLDFEVQVS